MRLFSACSLLFLITISTCVFAADAQPDIDFVVKILEAFGPDCENVYGQGEKFWFQKAAQVSDKRFTGFTLTENTKHECWGSTFGGIDSKSLTEKGDIQRAFLSLISDVEAQRKIIIRANYIEYNITNCSSLSITLTQNNPPPNLSYLSSKQISQEVREKPFCGGQREFQSSCGQDHRFEKTAAKQGQESQQQAQASLPTSGKNHYVECHQENHSKNLKTLDKFFRMALKSSSSDSSDECEDVKPVLDKISSDESCCVCLEKQKNVVYLPCKHLCTCKECGMDLKKCPLCSAEIQQAIDVFK